VRRIHPDDREVTEKKFRDAIASHVRDYTVQYRIVRPIDGEVRWISVRSTIEGMIDRSNGAPPDGESDGRQSSSDHDGAGEVADAERDRGHDAASQPASSPTAPPPAPTGVGYAWQDGSAATEQLTVNGVTRI